MDIKNQDGYEAAVKEINELLEAYSFPMASDQAERLDNQIETLRVAIDKYEAKNRKQA